MQLNSRGRVMPDPTFNEAAVRLDSHIVSVLKAAAHDLERQGIPSALIGQTMLRIGMQTVHATEGPKQLRESTAELLDRITRPRD